MTDREQAQAKALKQCVVDADAAYNDWDARFITSLAYTAVNDWHRWLTDGQVRQLRRMLSDYSDQMKAAGFGELVFTNAPKKPEAKP